MSQNTESDYRSIREWVKEPLSGWDQISSSADGSTEPDERAFWEVFERVSRRRDTPKRVALREVNLFRAFYALCLAYGLVSKEVRIVNSFYAHLPELCHRAKDTDRLQLTIDWAERMDWDEIREFAHEIMEISTCRSK